MRTFPLLLVALFFFAACGQNPDVQSAQDRSGPIVIDQTPVFTAYTDGVEGYGRPALLFFTANDDVFSQATDSLLRQAYASGSVVLSTYSLDTHTSTELMLQNNVFTPNTVVLLDAHGKRVGSLVHPTKSELYTLLNTGSFPH